MKKAKAKLDKSAGWYHEWEGTDFCGIFYYDEMPRMGPTGGPFKTFSEAKHDAIEHGLAYIGCVRRSLKAVRTFRRQQKGG